MTLLDSTIIGIVGYARTGKDTLASHLGTLGWERVAFADNVRKAALAINPVIGRAPARFEGDEEWLAVRLADLVEQKGWEEAKASPEVRRLLQTVGTEAGRDIHGMECWVEAAFRPLQPGTKYVFTDCRFPNEADAIRRAGGTIVRIHRLGTGPQSDHPSEVLVDSIEADEVISMPEQSDPAELDKAMAYFATALDIKLTEEL